MPSSMMVKRNVTGAGYCMLTDVQISLSTIIQKSSSTQAVLIKVFVAPGISNIIYRI